MGETIYVSFDKKSRFTNFKNRVKFNAMKTIDWVCKNPQVGIVLITVAASGTAMVFKAGTNAAGHIAKNHLLNKEENLKNLYCYDPSLGHYWKLSRELTNKEWLEIERRKYSGERLGDILDAMKVLH